MLRDEEKRETLRETEKTERNRKRQRDFEGDRGRKIEKDQERR